MSRRIPFTARRRGLAFDNLDLRNALDGLDDDRRLHDHNHGLGDH